ncbi:hypothetical protein [Enhygromyxa salina]|uniref:hypothetical protein n=1 Tax=Enhygromyxa salina TaxID=215803 RepID=UPI000D08B789|nr:hypothetical protein [Enhygromyxa salina]
MSLAVDEGGSRVWAGVAMAMSSSASSSPTLRTRATKRRGASSRSASTWSRPGQLHHLAGGLLGQDITLQHVYQLGRHTMTGTPRRPRRLGA